MGKTNQTYGGQRGVAPAAQNTQYGQFVNQLKQAKANGQFPMALPGTNAGTAFQDSLRAIDKVYDYPPEVDAFIKANPRALRVREDATDGTIQVGYGNTTSRAMAVPKGSTPAEDAAIKRGLIKWLVISEHRKHPFGGWQD